MKTRNSNKKIDRFTYNEDNRLGKGQFGYVYRGEHSETKEPVAVKVIPIEKLENEYLGKLLVNEVESLKKLNSENIVRFIDLKMTKNNIYLITEFCDSGDLDGLMEKKKRLSEAEVLDVLKQVCEGFKEMKKYNIIHRDLKPANILLHQGKVKIADMGFARSVQNHKGSILQSTVGSPMFMSPQLLFQQLYTSKCDVWSLGVILYQLFYGVVPWNALDIVELTNKIQNDPIVFPSEVPISLELTDLIIRCLKFEERDRLSWDEVFEHPASKMPSYNTVDCVNEVKHFQPPTQAYALTPAAPLPQQAPTLHRILNAQTTKQASGLPPTLITRALSMGNRSASPAMITGGVQPPRPSQFAGNQVGSPYSQQINYGPHSPVQIYGGFSPSVGSLFGVQAGRVSYR